ncbi:M56 family metallopeptidase [Dyadobacter sandarakinus]|uniref:Peptidase M56 domain-containing protein n=1 Tax=Dyadobacter sandarakinus TaxID=2747268 RepID=A0ABX7I1U9_9BACT|nr:M56 family metallopeptidase [Dyadobacter sandarakinus]QRR00056.1 hypothetical protein HWI92_03570 [Dyadobacter sandarakinus]
MAALALSLGVPLISLDLSLPENVNTNISESHSFQIPVNVPRQITSAVIDNNTDTPAAIWHYIPHLLALVSLVLLIRYAWNILVILRLKSRCNSTVFEKANLILVPGATVTYTFLNNIFLPENSYRHQAVRDEVLTHELAHARQLHSLDILLTELVQALFWFNPFLFFYRKAIRINHEFLADEAVLIKYPDVRSYQLLLLNAIALNSNLHFTSSFNYSITKKRLAMMTAIKNRKGQYVKQCAIAILMIALTFIFSDKTYSQTGKPEPSPTARQVPAGTGLAQDKYDEFFGTISKHTTIVTQKSGRTSEAVTMPVEVENHVFSLYEQMSKQQQQAVRDSDIVIFQMDIPVKKAPDAAMFENWKKPTVFGIWINERHVPNTDLNKYKASDIAEYSLSKLYGKALKGRSYKYQLDLMTNDYFDKTFDDRVHNRVVIGKMIRFETKPKRASK